MRLIIDSRCVNPVTCKRYTDYWQYVISLNYCKSRWDWLIGDIVSDCRLFLVTLLRNTELWKWRYGLILAFLSTLTRLLWKRWSVRLKIGLWCMVMFYNLPIVFFDSMTVLYGFFQVRAWGRKSASIQMSYNSPRLFLYLLHSPAGSLRRLLSCSLLSTSLFTKLPIIMNSWRRR